MSELKEEINLYGLTMIAIGSCIGSGIFLTPAQIAGHLPSPVFILLVWAVGGLITLTGALTFAELGAMFPQAGGVYVYLKEAYGDAFGFLYGWAYLVVINSGAIAALSIAFATYLGFLFPLGAGEIRWIAIISIFILTGINIFRVKAGEVFASVFTGLKLAGIGAIALTGLLLGSIYTNRFNLDAGTAPGVSFGSAFGLALIGVLWSYGGWQHASYLAGEVKNPRRVVPRAMILGAAVVTLVYIFINLAYLFLLPVAEIAGSGSVAADAIQKVLPFGATLMAWIIALSVIGTAGIYVLSAPRIYYAMAKDGIFFKSLARVHPRFRTPLNAILAQSTWAIILLLFWGTFEDVITYVVFTDWIFFAFTAFSVFIFRRKMKDARRPYRTPGYPVTPAIFVIITAWFVINALIEKPLHAWASLFFMLVGLAVFFFFKKSKSKTGGSLPK